MTPKLFEGLQIVVELEADALLGLPHFGDDHGSVAVDVLAVLERDDLGSAGPLDLPLCPVEGLRMSLKAMLASPATMRSTVTPALAAEALTSSSTRAGTLGFLDKCEALASDASYPAAT